MTGHFNTKQFTTRYLAWDEENRLMGVADNNQVSFYLYDAAGERTVKFTGHNQWVDVNGIPQGYAGADKLTLYASPYLVATSGQYTKHYYAGEQRILSKIGGGGLGNFHYIAPVAQDSVRRKVVNLENRVRFTGELLQLRTFDVKPKYSAPCNQEGMLVELCDYKNVIHPEDDRYFYHPDHLGSSSWITGTDGTPVQHLSYLPFGEEFVDQKTSNWSAAHKFSGKEKDVETGYNYFGARYYWSNGGIWLSVDPLTHKLPHQSPYMYCNGNPVKLVDPDGKFPISMHVAMVKKAMTVNMKSYYFTPIKERIIRGTGVVADISRMSIAEVHMDNMSGYSNLKTAYNNTKNSFSSNMKNGNHEEAGVNLHTIADFYAHSNYIPLYQEYVKQSNGKLSNNINNIPTFSEAMQDPALSKFLDEKGLKTGTYGDGLLAYPKDKMSDDPNSHGQMNMDTNASPNGKKMYNNTHTRHDAARAVAQKELNKIVGEN